MTETMTLELPVNLQERRSILEKELSNVVQNIVHKSLAISIKELCKEFKITGSLAVLEWDFYPESDDEGGSIQYPTGIYFTVDGRNVDMEEHLTTKIYNWSEEEYEQSLDEEVRELLHEWKYDLFDHSIFNVSIDISE